MSLLIPRLALAVPGIVTLLSLAALSLSASAADQATPKAAGAQAQAAAPSRQVAPLPGMRVLRELPFHEDDEGRLLMSCLQLPSRPSEPLAGEERLRAKLISLQLVFSGEQATPSTRVTFSEVEPAFQASVQALLGQARASCASPLEREQFVYAEVLHDPVSGKAEWRPLKLLGVSGAQHPVCPQEPEEPPIVHRKPGWQDVLAMEMSVTVEMTFPPGRDKQPLVRVTEGKPSAYGQRFVKDHAEELKLTCAGPRKGNLYFKREFNFQSFFNKRATEKGSQEQPREVAFADWWAGLTEETAPAWLDTTGLGCPVAVIWRQRPSPADNEFRWAKAAPPMSAQRVLLAEWLSKAKLKTVNASNEVAITNNWLKFELPCGQLG